jgi:hypothetical protein
MIQISRRSLLALAGASLAPAQTGPAASGDARNLAAPGTRTVFPLREWQTREEWERHAAHLRRRILLASGLWPLPGKPVLHTRPHNRFNQGTYTTECVLIETWPGLWIAANFYLPVKRAGKVPGILVAHGHWTNGRLENTDNCSTPSLCANLASQGFAALAYDMVGYNESDQLPHKFGNSPEEQAWHYGPLGVQLWNSIRMLDYLASRDEIDGDRLGMTGASGGGTQTFLLAALDPRLKAVAPVNMISAHFQGGCECENASGLRWSTNNVETGAMAAPRPQLLVAATGDWTRDVPRVEYPAIRKIYGLYGAEDQITTWQQSAGHNYNLPSREAVYRFFHSLWGNPAAPPPNETAGAPSIDSLRARLDERPTTALTAVQFFEEWKKRCQNATKTLSMDEKRARLHAIFGLDQRLEGLALQNGYLTTAAGWRMPAQLLNEGGKSSLLLLSATPGIPAAGPAITSAALAVRLFGRSAERPVTAQHFLTFNAADPVCRVQDTVAAITWLRQRSPAQPVEIIAADERAAWAATVAQALLGRSAVRLRGNVKPSEPDPVPGLEFAGGIATIRELAAL